MIGENEFDRLLISWLETEGPQDVPADVVDRALMAARRQGQAGGRLDGLLGRRWPTEPAGLWSPVGRRVMTLIVVALLTLAAIGVALVGGAALVDRMQSLPAPSVSAAPTDAVVRSGPPRFLPTGAMSGGREYPTLTKLSDGRVLVFGGFGETGQSPVEIYDPTSGTFKTADSMPSQVGGYSATLLEDGRVLIAGGTDPTTTGRGPSSIRGVKIASLYDPATDAYTPTGSMNEGHRHHNALRLHDGRVLVVDWGGKSELYDPRAGTWSMLPDVTTGGSADSLTLLADGRVLHVRGDGASVFDPTTLSWSDTGRPVTQRNQFRTVTPLPDGGALVAGGTDDRGTGQITAERFDPLSHTFRPTGTLTFARKQPSAVGLADGRVLILGFSGEAISTAELYDPRSGTFSVIDDPAAPAIGSGVLLDDGRVFITSSGEAQALLFDPGSPDYGEPSGQGTFKAFSATSAERIDPSMTMLRDGTVFIAGGRDASGATLASAERFDPIAGTFTSVGSMSGPRVGHTATLTGQDSVLLTGGQDGTGILLSSAELFDGTVNAFYRPILSIVGRARGGSLTAGARSGSVGISWSQGSDFIIGGTLGDGETPSIVTFGDELGFV